MSRCVLFAIIASILFGASTPFAKLLVGEISPLMLSGLLYLGSGLGLGITRIIRDRGWNESALTRQEWPWLFGAILFGGVLGPVALMFGLTVTNGSTASLLLNLEAVLTALIAWIVFRESVNLQVALGMVAIVAGGVVLSWPTEGSKVTDWIGPFAIAAACFCWAIDNNLTRKISASDALFIAGIKGLIAGAVNCSLALFLGIFWPESNVLIATMLVGLLGYGISLVMFVLALRGLGTARTAAYFSIAPFIGAIVAIILLNETTPPKFWIASVLIGIGVWLHLTERHEHEHIHESEKHRHMHTHDDHHQHEHSPDWNGQEPHDHLHQHTGVVHMHPHFPDIHHRHMH